MEVITEGWPEEGKDQVLLDKIVCTYIQEQDNSGEDDNSEDPQQIIISSRDGGGGKYINFKTDSWSITGDDFEKELIPLFEDFKHRMNDVAFISNTRSPREEILEEDNSK